MQNFKRGLYDRYVETHTRPGAAASDEIPGLNPYHLHLVRRRFPSSRTASILDLGCGDGALIATATRLGYSCVSGVDCSAQQISIARSRGLSEVSEGDLFEKLASLPDCSIDCVIAFDVIEHFSQAEAFRIVADVLRVLRPSGRFLMHVPNGESPFFGRIRYGDLTHEMAYTRRSSEQLLKVVGFSRIESYEDEPVPHGVPSVVRLVLWKALRSVLRLYLTVESGTAQGALLSQNILAVGFKAASLPLSAQ